MPETLEKLKIFVSYSMQDTKFAKEFVRALKEQGLDAWLDQFEIPPGSPIQKKVEDGLRNSDALVILLSEDSVRNPNIFFELGAAIGLGKRVVPIVAKDFNATSLPVPLRFRQHLVRGTPDQTAAELVRQLEKEQR